MKKETSWQGTIITAGAWNARTRDGRHARQAQVAVRSTSKKAAAAALGVTLGELNNYFSDTANPACLAVLDAHPLLTVILHPMDPGDTILGQTDWIVRP